MSKKQLTPKIARLALFLEDFNYEIIHRPGKQMRHVDCLSRYPVMTITYDEITTKLANCQRNDEYMNSLKTLLENKQINDFVVKNDVLYKIENDNYVLVVPQQMQTEIVKNIHSKGHLGINKTESMENIPRSTYHVDFLGPLQSTNKNYDHILSIIDAFAKFVWLYPVKSTSSRDALEKLKQQDITFGNPHRIITDKGTAITSKEFREYCVPVGDIFAIQRTQFGTGLKLRPKFFGPYEVVKVKPKDRYDVRKIGLHEGPNTTSTAADHMKMWGETV
ncbi:transposon Tf2-9 polyprotein [Trichonephila clavipes]|nr:transposon Tf2-9 polyprotein [Trichonephila clavipes]